jgi:hypothetical protein
MRVGQIREPRAELEKKLAEAVEREVAAGDILCISRNSI